ncbi:MAG: hypothetical protein IPK25_16455 [Saprospiraceae bacterium]|nr:hypothetical protein [Saprospiraceae bacterium]
MPACREINFPSSPAPNGTNALVAWLSSGRGSKGDRPSFHFFMGTFIVAFIIKRGN